MRPLTGNEVLWQHREAFRQPWRRPAVDANPLWPPARPWRAFEPPSSSTNTAALRAKRETPDILDPFCGPARAYATSSFSRLRLAQWTQAAGPAPAQSFVPFVAAGSEKCVHARGSEVINIAHESPRKKNASSFSTRIGAIPSLRITTYLWF